MGFIALDWKMNANHEFASMFNEMSVISFGYDHSIFLERLI